MINKLVFLTLFTFLTCSGHAQNSNFIRFINSFQENKSKDPINLRALSSVDNQMTREEALLFIYNGDTSRLFCYQKIFSMETEKVSGISRELYLPSKCLRINMPNFIMVIHSLYQCKNPDELLKTFLSIKILNKSTYEVTDSLIAYSGTEYDSDFSGMINPANGNLFLVGAINKSNEGPQAIIYGINENLKFESLGIRSSAKYNSDNFQKVLESNQMAELFYQGKN